MRVMSDVGPVNLATGERWREVVGDGERVWEKVMRTRHTIEEEIERAASAVAELQRKTRERCLAEFMAVANHVEIDAGVGSDVEKVFFQAIVENDRRRERMREDEKLKAERDEFNAKRQAAGLEPVNQERAVPRFGDAPFLAGAEQMGTTQAMRTTPAEQERQLADEHRQQYERANRAFRFLRDHPEFNEFIQLLRDKVIEI